MARLATVIPQMANMLNTEYADTEPGGEDDSANSSGPFLGVASRSQRNSVITYYGIDRHDQWIFTPLFKYLILAWCQFKIQLAHVQLLMLEADHRSHSD